MFQVTLLSSTKELSASVDQSRICRVKVSLNEEVMSLADKPWHDGVNTFTKQLLRLVPEKCSQFIIRMYDCANPLSSG